MTFTRKSTRLFLQDLLLKTLDARAATAETIAVIRVTITTSTKEALSSVEVVSLATVYDYKLWELEQRGSDGASIVFWNFINFRTRNFNNDRDS